MMYAIRNLFVAVRATLLFVILSGTDGFAAPIPVCYRAPLDGVDAYVIANLTPDFTFRDSTVFRMTGILRCCHTESGQWAGADPLPLSGSAIAIDGSFRLTYDYGVEAGAYGHQRVESKKDIVLHAWPPAVGTTAHWDEVGVWAAPYVYDGPALAGIDYNMTATVIPCEEIPQ